MKVLVWYSEARGPAVVAVIPKKDGPMPPETARIPQRIPPGVMRQLTAKGNQVSWKDWAEHLTERLPIDGQWAIEDVPDGTTAQRALAIVRRQALERSLDPPEEETDSTVPAGQQSAGPARPASSSGQSRIAGTPR